MFTLTPLLLRAALPQASEQDCHTYAPIINLLAPDWCVDTPLRLAHFIAQVATESGDLRYTTELASGQAYEGRKNLGNTQPGDGPRFKGRGLIQLTGRANYQLLSDELGIDFVSHPKLLATPSYATLSALWYWKVHRLHLLADKDDLKAIRRRVNGGLNGYAIAYRRLLQAKKALRAVDWEEDKK